MAEIGHNKPDQNGNGGYIDDSDDASPKQVTKEFKDSVKEWVRLDDTIKDIVQKTKELKIEKKILEEFILKEMDSFNESTIAISDGKLRRNVSKTKSALKHETIQNALVEFTKDTEQAFKLTEFILEKRGVVERVKLKRTSLRKK